MSGGREEIRIQYEPDVELDEFESKLRNSQDRDMRAKMTSVGPHRDDFSFLVGNVDIRKFGSQGQQRTAALSLKLSEIELVKGLRKIRRYYYLMMYCLNWTVTGKTIC